MPPIPSSGAFALRDSTNKAPLSVFNRDLAKSALLQSSSSGRVGSAATATRLLETLTTIKTDVAKSKLGGAKRVVVAGGGGNASATPINIPTASTTNKSTPPSNSDWEKEKETLVAQILALQSQVDTLRTSNSSVDTTVTPSVSLEQFDTLRTELSSSQQRIQQLEQQLQEANDTITQLKKEREDAVTSEPMVDRANTHAAPSSPVSASTLASVASPIALPAVFSPVAAKAPASSEPSESDEFEPVSAEEMEASLGGEDLLNSTNNPANDSAASLNLSVSSSGVMSPTAIHHALPPSFRSPIDDHQSTLSPISRSASPLAHTDLATRPTLTASALKIQSLFRGRMERGYLKQGNEARLSALPLTSPSTPTPQKMKRQRRKSASPIKLDSSIVHEETSTLEDGEEKEDEDDMETSSVEVPRTLSFNSMDDDDSSTSSSSTPPLAAADAKRYSSEFRLSRQPLMNLDACWTLRSKSMNRLEELCRERGTNGFTSWTTWSDELKHFQRPMSVQLGDLRSSILREACRLLIAIADANRSEFEEQLAFYLPILWKSLYVTIKIISTTADETIMELVTRVATCKSITLVRTHTRHLYTSAGER